MSIDLPRHVKKPGGAWLLVETPAELEAALADGWVLRVPVPSGIVLTDAPEVPSAPFPSVLDDPDGVPAEAPEDEDDPAEDEDAPTADTPPKRGRGRPRKVR